MKVGSLKFAWKIKNFSSLQDETIYSDIFSLGPYKWKIRAYHGDNHLSIFLEFADLETLPSGWSLKAKYALTVVDQIDNKSSIRKLDGKRVFNENINNLGYPSFMSHKELHDPKKGFLVEDTCIIKAEVTIFWDDYLESHVVSKENNKVDGLAKNATEEDINAFFGDLKSVVFSAKIVSLDEEAKEASTVIEEALNTTPAENYNPYRMTQLRIAFGVLSSLDDCPVLILEQKVKLLSLKDNFIALPERAANAGKNIKLFADTELVKKTLDYQLRRCLIEFEKIKLETRKNDQNIATIQERVDSLTQIGEMKRKREELMSKQKELFKVSKDLKAELEVLITNCPELEAKMKVGREEEKMVRKEWDVMKERVSSLKKLFYYFEN